MDDEMVRLLLELPLRERVRREHRCPPSLADPRLDEAQADIMEAIIREVLDSLDLPDQVHQRALDLAAAALRRAAGEEHYDPMVSADQHRPAMDRDQQS